MTNDVDDVLMNVHFHFDKDGLNLKKGDNPKNFINCDSKKVINITCEHTNIFGYVLPKEICEKTDELLLKNVDCQNFFDNQPDFQNVQYIQMYNENKNIPILYSFDLEKMPLLTSLVIRNVLITRTLFESAKNLFLFEFAYKKFYFKILQYQLKRQPTFKNTECSNYFYGYGDIDSFWTKNKKIDEAEFFEYMNNIFI